MNDSRVYARVVRYGAGPDDLSRLLAAARESPHDETLHGAIADALDEVHPGHPVADLIRRQFGLGGHSGRRKNLWYEPVENSWDGTFPYAARLGRHGPFDIYLAHESPQSNSIHPLRSGSTDRWVVHAVSNQRGSRDTGYSFEFPHSEAGTIPHLFPGAADHIAPEEEANRWASRNGTDVERLRSIEAAQFDNDMDEHERNRD